jgi:hypothetical protein
MELMQAAWTHGLLERGASSRVRVAALRPPGVLLIPAPLLPCSRPPHPQKDIVKTATGLTAAVRAHSG